MSRERLQLMFFLGIAMVALIFTLRLGSSAFTYFSLSKEAPAQILRWEITPIKDRFGVIAFFSFAVKEKTWLGSSLLKPPYYLNESAALIDLKQRAKEPHIVWYHPKKPLNSALDKEFPLGLLIRTVICYGVLIYFFYLCKRVNCSIIN